LVFSLEPAAVAALPARSCLIDGEAIVTDRNGLAVFDLIRGHQPSAAAAVLCAFDLLELDGEDLRREPIETRKSTLSSLLRGKHACIVFNAHFIADGAIVRAALGLGMTARRFPPPWSGLAAPPLSKGILASPDHTRWLSDEPDPGDLMRPFPAEPMRMWPISTRVNNPEATCRRDPSR
jgi:hypothetical protein